MSEMPVGNQITMTKVARGMSGAISLGCTVGDQRSQGEMRKDPITISFSCWTAI